MKKLLLASTALAFSAGVAAAEVSVVGDARMGITYDDAQVNEWAFNQRIRIRFNASGTTDTGLTFGGWVRMQDAVPAALGRVGSIGALSTGQNISSGGHNVFIAGAFGRLAMGDVAGAVQSAVGDLPGVGLTGLGFNNENAFFQRDFGGGLAAAGGPNALYTYSMAGFTVSASISQINLGGEVYGIGVRYSADGLTVGAGFEVFDSAAPNPNHIAVGAAYDFGVAEVKATYGRVNSNAGTARRDQFGVGFSTTFDATTITGYARRDFGRNDNFGLGASYNLGGGASLVGGITYEDRFQAPSRTRADFGVSMSF